MAINPVYSNISKTQAKNNAVKTHQEEKTHNAQNTQSALEVQKNENPTAGVQLSERAQEYLAKLQEKYGDVAFHIVEGDVGGHNRAASGSKYNCFISADLLEKMAADEEVGKKYEGIIDQAIGKLDDLKQQVEEKGLSQHVQSYNITVNTDGTIDYTVLLRNSIMDLYKKDEEKSAQVKKPDGMDKDDFKWAQLRPLSDSSVEGLLEKLLAIVEGRAEAPPSIWEKAMAEKNVDKLETSDDDEKVKRAFSSVRGRKDGFDINAMLPKGDKAASGKAQNNNKDVKKSGEFWA